MPDPPRLPVGLGKLGVPSLEALYEMGVAQNPFMWLAPIFDERNFNLEEQ